MTTTEARQTALRVLGRVNPGRHGVCLYVGHDDGRVEYVIWTQSCGATHDHKLDAANTTEERLEAHLKGFCERFASAPI